MAAEESRAPRLTVTAPAELAGRVFVLDRAELVIGHSDTADLVLEDRYVSRRHALLTIDGDGTVTIRDLNSLAGTRVNGELLNGARALRVGDLVQFADLIVRFDAASDPAAPAAVHGQPSMHGQPSGSGASPIGGPPSPDDTAPGSVSFGGAYTVTGTTASPSLPGISGLTIKLVDKNIGGDQVLATTLTAAGGQFSFTGLVISADYLAQHHKTSPDLQAVATSGDHTLASSAVQYSSPAKVTLDIALPANTRGLPSEYEILTADLAVLHPGDLSTLQENPEHRDITYLANKSGWDARAVALAALSTQFAQISAAAAGPGGDPGRTQIWPVPSVRLRPELYYALLRAGVPADPNSLFRLSARRVQAIWQQAADSGVIPATLADELPAAVADYQTLAAAKALTAPPHVGVSTMQELLAPTLREPAQQQAFSQLYTRHQGDWTTFWSAVGQTFGSAAADRLRLTGRLAYLTINNAPLVSALLQAEAHSPMTSTLDLATRGYYDASAWAPLIATTAVPPSLPGSSAAERAGNYARLLAAQVRVAHPTAVLAQQVTRGVMPTAGGTEAAADVARFLTAHQADFAVGVEPLQAYLARNGVTNVPDHVVTEVRRLQRAYQLTPDDTSMSVLLTHSLDSAYAITRYDPAGFARSFADAFGSADTALLVHRRAQQIYGSTLNLALSYLGGRVGPTIGGHIAPVQISFPPPNAPTTYPVTAFATLEDLFGSLDYCDCSDCNSVLSPAAYLVDLLHFLDKPAPAPGCGNPQDLLLLRRPDLEDLPLTCANTNTALPYIDLVNETLEYFVSHGLSIAGYQGHDTSDSITSAELVACPQYVDDDAYTTLQTSYFPPPLPFHRPLALLRLHLQHLGVALPAAMTALRSSDRMTDTTTATSYGWRDILIEQLAMSRDEYRSLSDPDGLVGLGELYGLPDSSALSTLQESNLAELSRRLGISHQNLTATIQTKFINPDAALIPMLSRLGAPFATIKALHDNLGTPASIAAQFISALPAGLDARPYGGAGPTDYQAVVAWVTGPQIYPRAMSLITIAEPETDTGDCSGAALFLRYADPAAGPLSGTDHLKLIRFIRLWRKLAPLLDDPSDAAAIQLTDNLISALYPASDLPAGSANTAHDPANRALLDSGFEALIQRAGFLVQLANLLSIAPGGALDQLLACWAPIGTTGPGALYRRMFLTPTLLRQDPAFAPDASGGYLTDATRKLLDHESALCAACNLTGAEFALITTELGFDAATPLTLANVSAVFRFGWFAHTLGLSVRDFLRLRQYTGLDPFAPLDPGPADPVTPPALRFTALANAMADRGLTATQALYLLWNQDDTGANAPAETDVTGLAAVLAADFAAVEAKFTVKVDPDGTIAKDLMSLVYETAATDFYFGLLGGTLTTSVLYSAPPGQDALPAPVLAASGGRLAYDNLAKRLSYAGVLDAATAAAVDAASTDPALPPAIAALRTANEQAIGPFFATYPELLPLYTAFTASTDPVQAKRQRLLDDFLPVLKRRRKQEQALASLTAAAGTDPAFADTLMQDPKIMHADADATLPAIDDLTMVEHQGLSAAFFLGDDPTAAPDLVVDYVPTVSYAQTATVGGTPTTGNVLETTINGVTIAYTVTAADSTLPLLAASIAAAVNAATGLDPVTKLPINRLTAASASGPVITFAARDPSAAHGWFTLAVAPSAGASETYAAGSQLPAGTAGGPIAATLSGYLSVPQSGFYDLNLALDPGASVAVRIDGAAVPGALSGGLWSNSGPIPLTAGRPVAFTLTARSIKTTLALSWTSQGMGWQPVPTGCLYPRNLADRLGATYTRFLKAASLASDLSLAAAELGHLAAARDPGRLNLLATRGAPNPADAATLGGVLAELLDYARIKQKLAPRDLRLLAVLTAPAAALPSGQSALLSLTGWEQASVDVLLTRFFGDTDPAHLATVPGLRRVYDAYQVVAACGLSAAALSSAVTNAPTPDTVSTLQSALRGRYTESDWLTAVQPINDTMRVQQRDALVAYAVTRLGDRYASSQIHQTMSIPAATGATSLTLASAAGIGIGMLVQGPSIAPGTSVSGVSAAGAVSLSTGVPAAIPADTPVTFLPADAIAVTDDNSLYDYFLIDTQNQPPVLTSRVLLAISTTQLFVERILRNLEPKASPQDVKTSEWPWMKRYRVWQANREVFLWPENWLYPELRDNQSPFFQQLMSGLLQGDITDDTAATEYLKYLTSLEEVAKLEPCGLYYLPASDGSGEAGSTAYVVARTAGAHRKYYFREFTADAWTPWTEVKIDCEDLPLTPIVWNGRLLLFWLKAVKQVSPPQPPQTSGELKDAGLADIHVKSLMDYFSTSAAQAAAARNVHVEAILCWTEYYNGTWQPMKTSDASRPTTVGDYTGSGPDSFEACRGMLRLVPARVDATAAENLKFTMPDSTLVMALTDAAGSTTYGGFLLHNTHSLPVRFEDIELRADFFFDLRIPFSGILAQPSPARSFVPDAKPYTGENGEGTFGVEYLPAGRRPASLSTQVLGYHWTPRVTDAQPGLPDAWAAPFFYEDRQNLFYVTTEDPLVPIQFTFDFGLQLPSRDSVDLPRIPKLLLRDQPSEPVPAEHLAANAAAGGAFAMQRYLTSTTLTAALDSPATITYQGQVISPVGGLPPQQPAGGGAAKGA